MKLLKLFITLAFLTLALRPAVGQLIPVPTSITNLPTGNGTIWEYTASSTNGARWVITGASYASNFLYSSDNYGVTWNYRANFIGRVACSGDGRVVLCAAQGGGVMLSTNFCTNWTSIGFATGNPGAVSMSADGTKLAISGGPVRISTNSGASWYASSIDGGYRAWSADGTRLSMIGIDQNVYTSTNAGVTWTQTASPQINDLWGSLASSADGSVLAVCSLYQNNATAPGSLNFSTDYGATWSGNVADSEWFNVSVSGDGKKLTATSTGYDNIYGYNYPALVLLSTDKGTTWQPVGVPTFAPFRTAVLSPDGSMMLLVTALFDQYCLRYVMAQPDVPALNIASAAGNASLIWPYLTPGYVLQQNTNLTSTNWVTVTNIPSAMNQVILPQTNANNFYRLQKP